MKNSYAFQTVSAKNEHPLSEELHTFGLAHYTLKNLVALWGDSHLNTLEYFFILWTEKQPIKCEVDYAMINILPNHLLFIGPYRSLSLLDGRLEGIQVFIFSQSFYQRSAHDGFLLHSELFFGERTYSVPATINPYHFWELTVKRLRQFRDNKKELYTQVAHNCMEALILNAMLYFTETGKDSEGSISNTTELVIVNRFRRYLQKYHKKERKVSFYADLLHITPRQLTRVTERRLNKTAKQLITEKLVVESERMLTYSDLTISEIAIELGFYDEGNFSAFFKKHMGVTPRAYGPTKERQCCL